MNSNSNKNFKTIPTVEAHLEDIMRIAAQSNLEHWSLQSYREFLVSDEAVMLSAIRTENTKESKTTIVGFAVARLIMAEKYVELYNIAVINTEKNKGIGTILLEKISKISQINNLERILLEVRKSNTVAVEFYRRQGFKIICERKNFYTNPSEHALTMEKTL